MHPAKPETEDGLLDKIGDALFTDNLPTLEKWMAFFRAAIAVGVLVLSSRIIATPPPFVQGFALVLPAPMWATFLLASAGVTWLGRYSSDLCTRRNGAVAGLIVSGALCGPLWIKAPGFCWVMMCLLIPQAIVGVRLHRQCKDDTGAGT